MMTEYLNIFHDGAGFITSEQEQGIGDNLPTNENEVYEDIFKMLCAEFSSGVTYHYVGTVGSDGSHENRSNDVRAIRRAIEKVEHERGGFHPLAHKDTFSLFQVATQGWDNDHPR